MSNKYLDFALKEIVNHEVNAVLDKIKAEIKGKYGDYDICEWIEDYDYEDNNISEYRQVGKMSDILEIIDRYRKGGEI